MTPPINPEDSAFIRFHRRYVIAIVLAFAGLVVTAGVLLSQHIRLI